MINRFYHLFYAADDITLTTIFVTLFFYTMSEAQHAHISNHKRGWRDRWRGLLAYKGWFNVFSNWKEIIISLKSLQNHTLIHACMYSHILTQEKEDKKWINRQFKKHCWQKITFFSWFRFKNPLCVQLALIFLLTCVCSPSFWQDWRERDGA